MIVTFQMDQLDHINFASDTTYLLMLEAFHRGYDIYFYHPSDLSMINDIVMAAAYKVQFVYPLDRHNSYQQFPILHEAEKKTINLAKSDVIWIRQDPPFDMAYITATFMLEKIQDYSLILNNPCGVRNAPEKLLVTEFSDLMPKTLITHNKATILSFLEEHEKAVIKPLYGNAGADVFLLQKSDPNYNSIIQYFLHTFKEQFIIQEFLEKVTLGDKRIILINGSPVGAINRVPASGDIKSNLAVGGRAEACKLTDEEYEICATIAPTLVSMGLFFTGIDIIDNKITEINVTSPTGLSAIKKLYGKDLSIDMWNTVVNMVHRRKYPPTN